MAWHQLLGKERQPQQPDGQQGSLLGPGFDRESCLAVLERSGAVHHEPSGTDDLLEQVVALLDAGKVVGWFQGRMEFGPRALGNRSILGDPRKPEMQARINRRIKFRESFRPFAACILAEEAEDWFEMTPGNDSPYMLLVTQVREHRRLESAENPQGLERLQTKRSTIPAVTHVDHSCRIQTVDGERNPQLRALLERFHAATGCPALVNTSFNVRGEPVVCTPAEAWHGFMHTDMDALVLGDFLLLKSEQAPLPNPSA